MVLGEYAFILRVIQMEKRKCDAARRTLSKTAKAVVAANQVTHGHMMTVTMVDRGGQGTGTLLP